MFLLYRFSHLEDFIRAIYYKININSPYQLYLYDVADALNIGTYSIPSPSQVVNYKGRNFIFLDDSLTLQKQFEEFSHELGHIFLHDADQQDMHRQYRDYQEWKADLFALHFCVPTFMLLQLPIKDLSADHISEVFGVTQSFANKRLTMHKQKIYNNKLYFKEAYR